MTRNLSPAEQALWHAAVERNYGVRLTHVGDLYAQRGLVYAGSEYVARLGATNDPADATQWSASLGHMPLGRTVESSPYRWDEGQQGYVNDAAVCRECGDPADSRTGLCEPCGGGVR